MGDRVQRGGGSGSAHSMEYIVNTHDDGSHQKELKPPPMLFEVGHKFRTTVIIGDPNYALLASSTAIKSDNWMVCTSGTNEDQGSATTAVMAELVPPTEADHTITATTPGTDDVTSVVKENNDDGGTEAKCSVTSHVDECQVWIDRDEIPVAPDIAGLGQLLANTTGKTDYHSRQLSSGSTPTRWSGTELES